LQPGASAQESLRRSRERGSAVMRNIHAPLKPCHQSRPARLSDDSRPAVFVLIVPSLILRSGRDTRRGDLTDVGPAWPVSAGAQALGASRCSSSAPGQIEAREWRRRLRQRRRLMPRTRSLVARSGRSLGFGGIQPRAHESFEGSSVYSPLRLSIPLVGLARAFAWGLTA
jgi:hypothetical protein